jgi:hypothetical protein
MAVAFQTPSAQTNPVTPKAAPPVAGAGHGAGLTARTAPVTTVTPDAVERAWKTLGVVNEWVRFLDGKATAILAADAAIVAAVVGPLKDSFSYLREHLVVLLLFGAMFGCLGRSVLKGLHCVAPALFPRKFPLWHLFDATKPPSETDPNGESVLFFEHVASAEWQGGYRSAALSVFSSNEKTFYHLTDQIQANSIVARQKSMDIGQAIQSLVWALIFGTIAGILALILR